MKVSIIVPVYKTEIFLRKCVESLFAQTFSEFEIILIDDGSPDNCGAICDNLAGQHENIKVIHQENQGLACARNAGIAAAAGEWIMFVDSDDWVEPEMLEVMLKQAEGGDSDADICISGYVMDKNGESHKNEFKKLAGYNISGNDKVELYKQRLNTSTIGGARSEFVRIGVSVAKLYRRGLITDNDITFKQFSLHEDGLFNLYAIQLAKKIVCCEGAFYHYVINPSSATNTYRPGRMESTIVRYLDDFLDICDDIDHNDKLAIYNSWACMAFLSSVRVTFTMRNSPYTFAQSIKEIKKLISNEPYKTILRDVDAGCLSRSLRIRQWLLKRRWVSLYYLMMLLATRFTGR